MDENAYSAEGNELLTLLTKAVFWNCDIDKFDYIYEFCIGSKGESV